jgi:UPF0176 protein|tara:strand:- start:1149 stop:2060 length:912 start_codon:yes stop_codon:yes gene_type:complete
MAQIIIRAFYKFVSLEDFAALQKGYQGRGLELNIKGTILLAKEGINGTISGSREELDAFFAELQSDQRLKDLRYKESIDAEQPFYRLKVRLKKEIVSMGMPEVDPNEYVGTYLESREWNELLDDPDTVVIDTRNHYEVSIGTFKNAIDPKTKSFREFPQWVEENKEKIEGKKIAMFCTGGIRCEKATSFMKLKGYKDVFHLNGGILQYLEDTPKKESKWEGECFVFDNRVTVDHELQAGSYDLCHACRMPLSEEDLSSEHYEKGVSCPHCHEMHTEERREAFKMRQKQIELAAQRGTPHFISE